MTDENNHNPLASAGQPTSQNPPAPATCYAAIEDLENNRMNLLGELYNVSNQGSPLPTYAPIDPSIATNANGAPNRGVPPPAYDGSDPSLPTVPPQTPSQEDLPGEVPGDGNPHEENPNQPHSRENLTSAAPRATDQFIRQAPPATTTQLANIGEQLAKMAGKFFKNKTEKILHVFETVAKCVGKVIKNPVLKKFVNAISDFIGKFVEKTKSVASGAKEAIGKFTSGVLSAIGKDNSQSRA